MEEFVEQFSDNERVTPIGSDFDQPATRSSVEEFLRKLGADERLIAVCTKRINDLDVQKLTTRFRSYAENNSKLLLSALAALAIGVATEEIVRRQKAKRTAPKRSSKKRASSKRASSKRASSKSTSSKRTLIEPHPGDKRYIRRDARGRIKESDDVGRSLSADRRRHSKKTAKKGQGDRGDR